MCKKLLTAFLCLGHVVVQKSSPIEVDDEWGNDGTDFQRERKHETGMRNIRKTTVLCLFEKLIIITKLSIIQRRKVV